MSRVAFVHSNIAVKQFESEMFVIKTAQKNISFTQKSSIYDIVFKHWCIGFIATYAISAYHHESCEFESHSGKVYSMHHYVKFVSDLQQIGGFLQVLWFPPPIKLTTTI
jgi:hypothetical protein